MKPFQTNLEEKIPGPIKQKVVNRHSTRCHGHFFHHCVTVHTGFSSVKAVRHRWPRRCPGNRWVDRTKTSRRSHACQVRMALQLAPPCRSVIMKAPTCRRMHIGRKAKWSTMSWRAGGNVATRSSRCSRACRVSMDSKDMRGLKSPSMKEPRNG